LNVPQRVGYADTPRPPYRWFRASRLKPPRQRSPFPPCQPHANPKPEREDLQRGDILSTRGVYGLKPVLNQGRFLDDLENVKRALEVNPTLETTDAIPLGHRVRVVRGPFVGRIGIFEKRRSRGTVVIGSIVMVGGIVLEVDARDLEPVD
jgi:hypothetical protein